jgi:mitochondrial fission protein ELM1
MKPTIPTAFFDLCLIPEHDLARSGPDNVIPTKGMLNRLPARRSPKDEQGLLLIGGPSKHHGWDPSPLAKAVSSLVNARPAGFWKLTDSRRTPPGFLELISDLDLEIHPCSTTAPDWLPAELGRAREVWVTEDSMSMIYEALTARARVGLLAMPRKGSRSRVVRGIDQLIQDGWTRFFADGDGADLPEAPAELHEASRCATEVLRRFFPNLA